MVSRWWLVWTLSASVSAVSKNSIDIKDVNRHLQSTAKIDLVDLNDFDVQLALTEDVGISSFDVNDVVTKWMNEVFSEDLQRLGLVQTYASFKTVYLLQRSARLRNRRLQSSDNNNEPAREPLRAEVFTARFKGAAIFERTDVQLAVPARAVSEIQERMLSDTPRLQALFVAANATGLGPRVIDVRAFLALPTVVQAPGNESLEIVIIVAIVVACLAFLMLVVAILMAWKTDRRNRQAYLVTTPKSKPDTTANSSHGDVGVHYDSASPTPNDGSPPPPVRDVAAHEYAVSEIDDSVIDARDGPLNHQNSNGGNNANSNPAAYGEGYLYPESIISDDISTSLSQYYRSGMATNGVPDDYRNTHNTLNDAASMSSMDSYGYSLDGYGNNNKASDGPSNVTTSVIQALEDPKVTPPPENNP